jgi:TPR repeat protein
MPQDDVAHPRSIDAGSRAEELRVKGKCDQALPLLRGIIDNGGASEIAQFNLGLCLLDLAAVDTQHAEEMKKEATQWIVSAADTGLARAQARAVTLLLDGTGGTSDPVEAQKWAILYRGNPTRYNFGLKDLPDDLTTRLDKALTGPQRVEARKRANAWMPKVAAAEE